VSSPEETAGCLTAGMKPNVPRPVRMEPALVGEQIVLVPGLGAELLTTARRYPAQSLPLVCASATSLVPNLGSPRGPDQPPAGMTPGHSSAVSAPSCARAAGLTSPCYARRAANGVDAWTAAAQLAVALALFVCVAIPLLRENEPVSPAPEPHLERHLVLDEPEGVAGCSAPLRPPPCVVGGCQWWKYIEGDACGSC
jgi:hypothetical protein